MPEVIIYSRSFCGYCELAKRLLEQKGVPYSEVDVGSNPAVLSEMIGRSGGRMSLPQIFVGDRHVGGFNELAHLERRGGLEDLLRGVGVGV
jgi:glutaredoxin 3